MRVSPAAQPKFLKVILDGNKVSAEPACIMNFLHFPYLTFFIIHPSTAMPALPTFVTYVYRVSRCWYCNKTFGRLFVLKRHEKMHTRGVSADPHVGVSTPLLHAIWCYLEWHGRGVTVVICQAPNAGRRKKAKAACTNCQASKQACDDNETCDFCSEWRKSVH
jgi:hypothetical protein